MSVGTLEDPPMCDYCRGEADGECTCLTLAISKPSLAELQLFVSERRGLDSLAVTLAAVPLLVEIAAAAMAWEVARARAQDSADVSAWVEVARLHDALCVALGKARP